MKNAVMLDANDIKKIIAKEFNVPESNVVKSQYTYTVALEENSKDGERYEISEH